VTAFSSCFQAIAPWRYPAPSWNMRVAHTHTSVVGYRLAGTRGCVWESPQWLRPETVLHVKKGQGCTAPRPSGAYAVALNRHRFVKRARSALLLCLFWSGGDGLKCAMPKKVRGITQHCMLLGIASRWWLCIVCTVLP
jgi:hypothetical protein